ncbi:membrane protein [Klebsiella pneumoniae]|uniref:Membrane protein n=1 Tax=Klebsiella pneumoniae TaxID=573 RepID=A0A2X1QFP2_KLEPN|nr:membrane protein [Klebsiella pneumoniae]
MEISTQKLSDGIVLTLRSPSGSTKSPVIILCHGFCGIREILLPDFAEAFTRAGFSTITFDYRGFGDSDGERGRLVPAMQIDDIISVVNWAREQPSLDAQRIGLWGTSFGDATYLVRRSETRESNVLSASWLLQTVKR